MKTIKFVNILKILVRILISGLISVFVVFTLSRVLYFSLRSFSGMELFRIGENDCCGLHQGDYILVKIGLDDSDYRHGQIIFYSGPFSTSFGVLAALPGEYSFIDLATGKTGYLTKQTIESEQEIGLSEKLKRWQQEEGYLFTESEFDKLFSIINWLEWPRFTSSISHISFAQRLILGFEDNSTYRIINNTWPLSPSLGAYAIPRGSIIGIYYKTLASSRLILIITTILVLFIGIGVYRLSKKIHL